MIIQDNIDSPRIGQVCIVTEGITEPPEDSRLSKRSVGVA